MVSRSFSHFTFPVDFLLCFTSQILVTCPPLITDKGNGMASGDREGAKLLAT